MPAEHLKITADDTKSDGLRRVAKALSDGAIVAFPTETVYGVGANAASGEAMRRLRDIKRRDADKPFTVHVGRRESIDQFVPSMSPLGRRLVNKGLPGPMTLIFKVGDPTAAKVYATLSREGAASVYGGGSVGIRYPASDVACALVRHSEAPIVASSANAGGDPAPNNVDGMTPAFLEAVDFVVDTGDTRYRKASTIVELNGAGYRVLREGVLDERTVQRLARVGILFVCTGNTCRSPIAEGLCMKALAAKLECRMDELAARGISIQSAGTSAWGGGAISPQSVEACARRDVDISGHRSQVLTDDLVRTSDYIFAMTRGHVNAIRAMSPEAAERTLLLDENGDIADPVGGTGEQYEQVAQQIERALTRRLEEVSV